jgi:hypothetical protein
VAAAPAPAAPTWAGLSAWGPAVDQSVLLNLPVPEFVPAANRSLTAPDKDGKPLVPERVSMAVKIRHGLLKPPDLTPQPGQPGMMGRPMPAGQPTPPSR